MLLIDRIKIASTQQKYKQAFLDRNDLYSVLFSSTVIEASNVARYYYYGEQETWDFTKDYPNIAPFLDNFFVEWAMPKKVRLPDGGMRINPYYTNVNLRRYVKKVGDILCGVHFYAIDMRTLSHHERDAQIKKTGGFLPDLCRWVCVATSHMWINNWGYVVPTKQPVFIVNEDGSCGSRMKTLHNDWSVDPSLSFDMENNTEIELVDPVALLAISFANCKNISIKQRLPNKALSRKHKKKKGVVLSRYHVLDIEPMKQVLRTNGNAEQTGLKKALHICRGHFKDYSKGNGLFGKHKGLFWCPQHTRGSTDEGVVAKDYRVVLPNE